MTTNEPKNESSMTLAEVRFTNPAIRANLIASDIVAYVLHSLDEFLHLMDEDEAKKLHQAIAKRLSKELV